MKKQYLQMSWCDYYKCPGGDCGLTCCTADWKIVIDDDEIEMYKKLDSPFRDEILNSIDVEKNCMKNKDGKCALLDENGFCKIVLNCGDEYLSKTCRHFPWCGEEYGVAAEQVVEIVCPVVANFLFDEKPIYFSVAEKEVDEEVSVESAKVYLGLFLARRFLIDILQIGQYNFVYGKSYIVFKVFEAIIELADNNNINQENVSNIIKAYEDPDVVISIFSNCNAIADKTDAKEKVIYQAFKEMNSNTLLSILLTYAVRYKPYIVDSIKRWLNDEDSFIKALKEYVEIIRSKYPMFLQNYLIYSLYCSFESTDNEHFGHNFSARFIELVAIQIAGMAVIEKYGNLDRKEFSVAIAAIDRAAAHSKNKFELMYDYYNKKQKENSIYFMMLLLS